VHNNNKNNNNNERKKNTNRLGGITREESIQVIFQKELYQVGYINLEALFSKVV
jgi:hypothetical protein